MTTLTTHRLEGDLAVFLIGARVLKPWRPDAWFPAFAAMGPMLAELAREPEAGLLHARTAIDADLRGVTVVQYWRSIEDIYRYANDRERKHRPPGSPSTAAPAAYQAPCRSGTSPTRCPPAATRASTPTHLGRSASPERPAASPPPSAGVLRGSGSGARWPRAPRPHSAIPRRRSGARG